MTIGELLEKLRDADTELEVYRQDYEFGDVPIDEVEITEWDVTLR